MRNVVFFLGLVFIVSGCSSQKSYFQDTASHSYKRSSGTQRPYKIRGVWYYPQKNYTYNKTGLASWYGPGFHGKRTATGDVFDMNRLTAAHRTLKIPCVVRVTSLENGRVLYCVANDRGPFVDQRIIDLSRRAAQILGFHKKGIARVRVECLEAQSKRLAREGVWPPR